MNFDYKRLIQQNVEIDLPVLNKFLLCLPLRPGLILWGFLQLLAIIVVSLYAILEFAQKTPHMNGFTLVQAIVLFIITMIVSMLEIINCTFLVLGAQKKNANFLEVCYHYLKVKVPVYAALLIFSFFMKLFVHCHTWYYNNLDSWRYITLLNNQALGVIDLALQFYLLLLVRSEIIKLEHPINFSSLYQRFYQPSVTSADAADARNPKADVTDEEINYEYFPTVHGSKIAEQNKIVANIFKC